MKRTIWILTAVLAAGLAAAASAAEGDPYVGTYIGEAKCKMCHKKQHETWAGSKHAKNFEALLGDEKKNPDCLKCHTTGFGKGGFDISKSDEDNAKFLGTQCESCHGPGETHFKAPMPKKKGTIIKTPTSCASCHNQHVNFGELAKQKRGG